MKELDELLKEEDVILDIDKKINKKVNKFISYRVIKILICISLIIISSTAGILTIYDLSCYNPYNEEDFLPDNQDMNYDEFNVLLSTYIQMHYPGQVCICKEIEEGNEKTGVGKYSIHAKVQSSFDYITLGSSYNTVFEINNSKLSVEDNGIQHPGLARIVYEFKDPNEIEAHSEYSDNVDNIYNDISELPDSAMISASISFSDYLSLNDIIKLINKYDDAHFSWLALQGMNDYNVTGVAGGMSLYDFANAGFNDESKEKYPYFYVGKDDYTTETLKQKYLSNLQLLIDHPEFIKIMSTHFSYMTLDDLKHRYEAARNGLNVFGVKISIQKNDLLKMIEEEDMSYIFIHDVKLSIYSK